MTPRAFSWLRCPHCAEPLTVQNSSLRCSNNHTFDIAKQGYVNLLGRAAPKNADTPDMVEARARVLNSGLFNPVMEAVADAASGATRIVEVGAGTGQYLAHTLDSHPEAAGLATDVSVAAAKRAARVHPRAAAVVADTWAGLPVAEHAVDAVLCVFAPRNPAEFTRILAPGGSLVVVVPQQHHLQEIRAEYGLLEVPDNKADGVAASLPGWHHTSTPLDYTAELSAEEIHNLIAMGPNAFHDTPTQVRGGSCTIAVTVLRFTHP